MNCSVDLFEIEFESTVVKSPYSIRSCVTIGDVAVVLLNSFMKQTIEDYDFDLESDTRNVLGFNADGSIRWVIPEPPQLDPDADDPEYARIYKIDQTLLAKHFTGRLYEVAPQTGELLESWPFDHLPLGETTIQLAGEVHQIKDDGDRVFVSCRESDVRLYAFDKSGTELWRSDGRRGLLYLIEGDLIEMTETGPRRTDWYRLDKDTGERVEEIDHPF